MSVILTVIAASLIGQMTGPEPQVGWPVTFGSSLTRSIPIAAVDLDGDGLPELIVATLNSVHALRFDGTELPGWPFPVGVSAFVGDVTGDATPEVIVRTLSHELYVLSADGTILGTDEEAVSPRSGAGWTEGRSGEHYSCPINSILAVRHKD